MPHCLRTDHEFAKAPKRRIANGVVFLCAENLRDALDELSNRCLMICTRSLIRGANSGLNSNMHTRAFRIDEHLSKDCRYNPFRLVNTSGEDKSKLSSFFTSI